MEDWADSVAEIVYNPPSQGGSGIDLKREKVLEAATMDGCNAWQTAWYIKQPLIRPYIAYMLILTFAGNVQLFAEPQFWPW